MEQSIIPLLESVYSNFSPLERQIADYFIANKQKQNFQSKRVAEKLYVSEAALSRFAKKCGFQGYRQFIFAYENSLKEFENDEKITNLTKRVLFTYQELLNKSYSLINDEQIIRVAMLLAKSNRVYVYGIGSSGMCAREFKLRFMRLGLSVEYATDEHIMKMNSVNVKQGDLLIAISLGGKNLHEYLKLAKKNGATTIYITSNFNYRIRDYCDEIMLTAQAKNLDVGDVISPQFVVLVLLDVLYTHFLNQDYNEKYELLRNTLAFVESEEYK